MQPLETNAKQLTHRTFRAGHRLWASERFPLKWKEKREEVYYLPYLTMCCIISLCTLSHILAAAHAHYASGAGEGESGPSGGLSVLFMAGKPLREPIARHGPFVMNTREELATAFMEYQNDTFVKSKGSMVNFDGGGGGGEL